MKNKTMVKLTSDIFWPREPAIYGWIGASYQLGASMAAFGGGAIRAEPGDYRIAFLIAGVLCVIAGALIVTVGALCWNINPTAAICA